MALQVWLPLNGNLDNQGLTNITVTNYGATVDNNGKIGKCYSFGTSKSYLTLSNDTMNTCTTECTLAFWINITSWNTNYATYFQAGLGSTAWAHYIFGVLRNNAASNLCFTISNGSGNSASSYTTPNLDLNTWYHLTFVYKTGHCLIYVNGSLHQDYTTSYVPAFSSITKTTIGACNNGSSYQTNCKMNDVRIYDRALAPREIEILSRGLVCHYPLSDVSNQTPNNVAGSPTFNTSRFTGNWAHWGAAGNQGSYGQTTDKNYIYRKDQTYAHWVSNGSTATTYYIVYQSPAFSGGYRSMSAIIKEENGAKITESICYPGWNAHIGDHPQYTWDSITSLGNDFYLCKVDGFQQDGSSNLVCINIPPGKKIYLSEFYIENDRTVCSDFFYPSTTVYDTSGYQYNGTVNGLSTVSSDTARYSVSTNFVNSSYIQTTLPLPNGDGKHYTFSWWGKYTNYGGRMMWGYANGNRLNLYMASGNFYWNTGDGSNNPFGVSAATYGDNTWHHFAISGDGITTKLYIDGEFKANAKTYKGVTGTSLYFNGWDSSTSYNFNGSLSDFRLYATALSATQVAELYNTAVSVANNGTLMGYELVEV